MLAIIDKKIEPTPDLFQFQIQEIPSISVSVSLSREDTRDFYIANEFCRQSYIKTRILKKGCMLPPPDLYYIAKEGKKEGKEILGTLGVTYKYYNGQTRLLDEEVWFDYFLSRKITPNAINVGRFSLKEGMGKSLSLETTFRLYESVNKDFGSKDWAVYMITTAKIIALFNRAKKDRKSSFVRLEANLIEQNIPEESRGVLLQREIPGLYVVNF